MLILCHPTWVETNSTCAWITCVFSMLQLNKLLDGHFFLCSIIHHKYLVHIPLGKRWDISTQIQIYMPNNTLSKMHQPKCQSHKTQEIPRWGLFTACLMKCQISPHQRLGHIRGICHCRDWWVQPQCKVVMFGLWCNSIIHKSNSLFNEWYVC